MADPFQNVDAAGPDFIAYFADVMDRRQAEPVMEEIVAAYLDKLAFGAGSLTVEIGAGAGAVSRRIAARAAPGQVLCYEPSEGFVAEARKRAKAHDNLSFEVAGGAALPLADGAADHCILHTVLTHVADPAPIVAEAARILKPDGCLVICDGDFSKGTLAGFSDDPLDACARAFAGRFVTDAHLTGKLRPMVLAQGLWVTDFGISSRVIASGEGMLPWVEMSAKSMVEAGQIGQPLADALVAEYRRRDEAGTLYGYQAFATLVARKPA